MFGGASGLGYSATFFLGVCEDAGFELGASLFVIYNWFRNPGYTIEEKIIGPIPDYVQFLTSLYYMYHCLLKTNNVKMATDIVNWVKYFQAAVLPYVYIRSYMQGVRHDMFTASFTFMKAIFNTIDASLYFNERFGVIGKLIDGFKE